MQVLLNKSWKKCARAHRRDRARQNFPNICSVQETSPTNMMRGSDSAKASLTSKHLPIDTYAHFLCSVFILHPEAQRRGEVDRFAELETVLKELRKVSDKHGITYR